jgi:hypothetical protein
MTRVVLALLLALLVGCAKPTLDTTSEESYQKSLSDVLADLEEADRDEIQAFVAQAALADMFLKQGGQRSLMHDFNGQDGPQIAAALREQRAKRDREAAERSAAERAELAARKERISEFEELVSRVSASSLKIDDGNFIRRVTVEVANEGDLAVEGVRVRVRVVQPDRSVPWYDEVLQGSVEGGLEAGETKPVWIMGGSMYTGDILADVIKKNAGAVTQVSVEDVKFAGANAPERPLELSEFDAARLRQLDAAASAARSPSTAE